MSELCFRQGGVISDEIIGRGSFVLKKAGLRV